MQRIHNYFHYINIPPLLLVTSFFMVGIAYHLFITTFFIFFLISFCGTIFWYWKTNTVYYRFIIYSLFLIAGSVLHYKQLYDYEQFYIITDNQKISITGLVIDQNETMLHYCKNKVLTLKIDGIATSHGTLSCNKILLLYEKSNNNAKVGDTIVINDVIYKKPSNQSFQQYQIKENIIATVFGDKLSYQIINRPPWSIRYWIWHQKKRLLDSLSCKLSPETFRFFASLFLGNRMYVKDSLEETNEQFKTWGISHFLARSGLHLALFIFILQLFFCIIPLPLFVKQCFILLLSCLYFFLTWTATPFTRSFALLILNYICLFNKISFHLLHHVILVCLLFLLYSPLYLFFLDFQLTFALTFALAWFNQVTREYSN